MITEVEKERIRGTEVEKRKDREIEEKKIIRRRKGRKNYKSKKEENL